MIWEARGMLESPLRFREMDIYNHHKPHPQRRADTSQDFNSSPGGPLFQSTEQSSRKAEGTLASLEPDSSPSLSQIVHFPLRTGLNRSYDSVSLSPGESGSVAQDSYGTGRGGTPNASRRSEMTSNPKRAYRQRRKDPSCDACRERKVKCDATETSSCSECSSRNVRCQFTKETNRRMSSIKQFQDLERQLHQTRQQLAQYQSVVPHNHRQPQLPAGVDPGRPEAYASVALPPQRRRKPTPPADFSRVRADLEDYGRGLLQIPPPSRPRTPSDQMSADVPDLPPRHLADRFLAAYQENIHPQFPILHWPKFQSGIDQLYGMGTLAGLGTAWGAVFLCVLACGSLYTMDLDAVAEGKILLGRAISLSNPWENDFSIEEARAAFLTCVFLVESNLKSAGWVWLGSAVRISQAIGLHVEGGAWTPVEGEMRSRLWYSIYSWDRFLALELGKPLLINDTDYDTDLPEPADDEEITEEGIYSQKPSTSLLVTIYVVRSFQHLMNLFKLPYISQEDLQEREGYLQNCLSRFPTAFQQSALGSLDPRRISPFVWLQNARLALHRHNLSPSSPRGLRQHAIDQSVLVAQETANLLARCLGLGPSSGRSYSERPMSLASAASTCLCMHIWRCIILLLFRADFAHALTLVHAASEIGEMRPVNAHCGRYIDFFLGLLYNRLQTSPGISLDEDEEMIAYVSGDLQNNPDISWVWHQGHEGGGDPGRSPTGNHHYQRSMGLKGHPQRDTKRLKNQSPSEQDCEEWAGWQQIERRVRYLLEKQQQSQGHQGQQGKASSTPPRAHSKNSPSDASRMTIASII